MSAPAHPLPRRAPLRVAVVWPRPRAERRRLGMTAPDQSPDMSDALLFLEEHGFR